jgi:hypothetical protein
MNGGTHNYFDRPGSASYSLAVASKQILRHEEYSNKPWFSGQEAGDKTSMRINAVRIKINLHRYGALFSFMPEFENHRIALIMNDDPFPR